MRIRFGFFAVLMLLVFSPIGSSAQGTTSDSKQFATAIKVSRTSIYPFESLSVLASIKNISNSNQSLPSRAGQRQLSTCWVRLEGQSEWYIYGALYGAYSPAPPQSPKILGPGVEIQECYALNVEASGMHAFSTPGIYWVKADFSGRSSDPVKVEVLVPKGVDGLAYNYLRDRGAYKFFSADTIEQLIDVSGGDPEVFFSRSKPFSELENIIAKYPESIYAEWAKLGIHFLQSRPLLMRAMTGDLRASNDLTLKNSLEKSENDLARIADALQITVRVEAWFEAGMLAALLNDGNKVSFFQRAISARIDATMSERVTLFETVLREKPWLVYTPPRIPLEQLMSKTVNDLIQQGYDIEDFEKNHKQEYKQFSKQDSELYQKMLNKEITNEEYFNSAAILFSAFIRKYCTPDPAVKKAP